MPGGEQSDLSSCGDPSGSLTWSKKWTARVNFVSQDESAGHYSDNLCDRISKVYFMPIDYVIDAPQQTVQIICHGEVTAEEIVQHHQKILSDPQFHPDFSALIDASGLAGFGVSWDLLNRLKYDDPFSGKARRAVVAPGNFAFWAGSNVSRSAPRLQLRSLSQHGRRP